MHLLYSNLNNSFRVLKFTASDEKEKVKELRQEMKNNNAKWFINSERENYNGPIMERKVPDSSIFKDKEYIILEHRTARFCNGTESKNIDERMGNSPTTCGKEIEKESAGRIVKAYHRGVNRKSKLEDLYEQVFNFEKRKITSKIKYEVKLDGGSATPYDTIYKVTLNEEFISSRIDFPFKKALEILQVYNSSDKNNKIDGTVPVRVELKIGNRECIFMMSEYCKSQILISTQDSIGKYTGHFYPYYREEINKWSTEGLAEDDEFYSEKKSAKEMSLAKDMLTILNAQVDTLDGLEGLLVWNELSPEMLKISIELLALTQISEASHGKYRNDGRTPGMNKLFRNILRKISDGDIDFVAGLSPAQSFEKGRIRFGYAPSGSGGTGTARTMVRNIEIKGDTCSDMSDSSDDEI
ncbi:MAG: hypothetical protein KBD37_01700 [Burkholderiales bacterium]|nr:hypothetical protein [Burkholderiales bacterium]